MMEKLGLIDVKFEDNRYSWRTFILNGLNYIRWPLTLVTNLVQQWSDRLDILFPKQNMYELCTLKLEKR